MEEAGPRVPSNLSLAIAILLQASVAAWMGGWAIHAIWIGAAGACLLVWQWTRKKSKVLVVVLNALLLTIPRPGGWGTTGGEGDGNADNSESDRARGGGAAIVADKTFPGVILFPEAKSTVTLVPPLPFMKRGMFGASHWEPLTIPFFGSYWIYKWPERTLPRNAIVMRGEPDEKTFRSTDHASMRMEAHQNLGAFIPVSCCRAIELTVRDADRYPGTVSIEMKLANSSVSGKPYIILGTVPVKTQVRFRMGRREIEPQTLVYAMPEQSSIARFDEIGVRFVLGAIRNEHSAGIAIERFKLIPR